MRFKTTQKAVRNQYNTIIKLGYCDAQYLLQNYYSEAYTTRLEGWGCDVYDLGGAVALTTGYAPFGNSTVDYKTIEELENKAQKIWSYENKWHYNRKIAEVKKLVQKLIESARG